MPDGLYGSDTLAWAEQQADLLRRLAAGERVNDAVDWPNVIEELHDVGQSQLRACSSLLRQAILHLLKLHAWPGGTAAEHWCEEALIFLTDAEDCFTPSMRQHIEPQAIYRKALRLAKKLTDASGGARPWPETCPFTLDDLLNGVLDLDRLVAMLHSDG